MEQFFKIGNCRAGHQKSDGCKQSSKAERKVGNLYIIHNYLLHKPIACITLLARNTHHLILQLYQKNLTISTLEVLTNFLLMFGSQEHMQNLQNYLTDFPWGAKKKEIKIANSKKLGFSTPPISIFFSQKFQGLVLELKVS